MKNFLYLGFEILLEIREEIYMLEGMEEGTRRKLQTKHAHLYYNY